MDAKNTQLTFPDYEMLLPNQVYAIKKPLLFNTPDGKQVDSRTLLMIYRYSDPTEDEVAEYLKGKAGAAVKNINGNGIPEKMKAVDMSLLGEIAEGRNEIMLEIRSSTPAPDIPKRLKPSYVHADFILLPSEHVGAVGLTSIDAYEKLTSTEEIHEKGFGCVGHMTMPIYSGRLPNKSRMMMHLEDHSKDSDLLQVSGGVNYEDIENLVHALYSAGRIRLLTDRSESLLEAAALGALEIVSDNVKNQSRNPPGQS